MKSLRVNILLTIGALACAIAPAAAQSYPQKAVRMIMPVSAGSGSDVIGRIIATGMSEHFGQQVVVDNRAGAAGNIGAEAAARAAADGYNVLFAFVGLAANAVLYENLRYDVLRDFAPVTLLGSSAAIVVVHPSLPVKSIAELVKLAKQKPGAINYASGGAGTPTYIGAELFKRQAGIDLLHIPYRAGGEALTSVIAGETGIYFAPLASTLPYLKQGRLRALAVTSTRRLGLLPQYPTVAELGYPDYVVNSWHGMAFPAGTPKEIVARLHRETIKILDMPSVRAKLELAGFAVEGSASPEHFSAYIEAETRKWARIIKDAKLSAD